MLESHAVITIILAFLQHTLPYRRFSPPGEKCGLGVCAVNTGAFEMAEMFTDEWAIDPPTRVTSSGKRREYVRVGSTAASLPPTFPTEATRIGLSKCHSDLIVMALI